MKKYLLIGTVITAASLFGCVTTQGEHTYVNGNCITCFNNPITGEAVNYEKKQGADAVTEQASEPKKIAQSENECGKRKSKYHQTHHSADRRWCANLTLPGASYSETVSYKATVPVSVDLAYVRAKRHLQFKDPDDKIDTRYNDHTQWDGIAGTYYGIKARYGGPLKQMLWFCDYDLQLEKVNANSTKVKIKYRIYSRDMDPKEFHVAMLNKIKDIE